MNRSFCSNQSKGQQKVSYVFFIFVPCLLFCSLRRWKFGPTKYYINLSLKYTHVYVCIPVKCRAIFLTKIKVPYFIVWTCHTKSLVVNAWHFELAIQCDLVNVYILYCKDVKSRSDFITVAIPCLIPGSDHIKPKYFRVHIPGLSRDARTRSISETGTVPRPMHLTGAIHPPWTLTLTLEVQLLHAL